eukprot:6123622-Prymnesium_polylepis.1
MSCLDIERRLKRRRRRAGEQSEDTTNARTDRSSGRSPAVPDSLTGTRACGRLHRTRGHEPARHRVSTVRTPGQ